MAPRKDYARKRAAAKAIAEAEALVKGQPGAPADPVASDLNTLSVEVEEPAQRLPQTFAERMASRVKQAAGIDQAAAPTTRKASTRKKKTDVEINVLTKTLPVIAGVIASMSETWFKESYKVCAPRRAEVVAILGPIFAIIERRIEVSTEMSQDALDLLASGLALVGYAGRMYVTLVDIKNLEKSREGRSNGEKSPEKTTSATSAAADSNIRDFGKSESTGAVSANGGNSLFQPAGNVNGISASDDDGERASDGTSSAEGDRSRELAIVAAAFKQDARYRSSQGLL